MTVSCNKEEGGFVTDEFGMTDRTVTLPAEMPYEVAVFYNEWNPSSDDQYFTGVQAPVAAVEGMDGQYSFSYAALDGVQAYNYYFLAPYKTTLTRSIHSGNSAVKARVFSVQYPSAEGYDLNYDYMIGTNVENADASATLSSDEFKRIVSRLLVKIEDPENILEGKPLNIATLTFDDVDQGSLAGMFLTRHSANLENCGIMGVDENACGNGISLLYPEGLLASSGAYSLYYATLPCQIVAGTNGHLDLSTPDKTVSFDFVLDSLVDLNAPSELTVSISRSKEKFTEKTTQVQFFSSLVNNTIPLSQTTTSGSVNKWGFSSCARYVDEHGLPTALKMVQNSSITLPKPQGQILKSLRVYTHEDSYNSPLNDTYLILKNMGKPLQTVSCGHYNSDLYSGGCIEFAGLDNKMSKLTMAVEFSDEGVHHVFPVSAVLFETEAGEYKEDESGEIDYYETYMGGDEIVIGDMTISLAKNGDPKLIKPEKLTYQMMSDGGIYILDDSEGHTATPDFGTATTKSVAAKDNLVIIGRYGNSGIQTCVDLCELRMNSTYSVTFFNVKLTHVRANNTKSQYAFARNSADANHSTLRFVDCLMDYRNLVGTSTGYYLVFASNGANGYFDNVIIDNCIIHMTSETGKVPVIYYNSKSRTGGTFVDECIKVSNTVICTDAPVNGYLIWSGTDRSTATPFLSVDVQNCTFSGFYNDKAVFRAGELKSLKVKNNVFHTETTADSFGWMLYSGTADDTKYVLENNCFYNTGEEAKWKLFNSSNMITPAQSGNILAVGSPFVAGSDSAAGYVPVDESIAGKGVGATYDTKKFIKTEAGE